MARCMEFFEVLVRYEVRLWDAVDDALRSRGLVSAAQLQALTIIGRHGGAGRVQEVSAEIGITVGAASKLVDRLERDGLVGRHPNPADRRSSLVELTPTGAAALNSATQARDEALEVLLLEEEAGQARDALTVLLAHLSKTQNRVPA